MVNCSLAESSRNYDFIFLRSHLGAKGNAPVSPTFQKSSNEKSLTEIPGSMIVLCFVVLQILFNAQSGGFPRLYGLNEANNTLISSGICLHLLLLMVASMSRLVSPKGK